jgi:Domain of unknown function (DUF4148)
MIMNAKLLFVSTVALALVSGFAMADDTKPLTRAQVVTDYNQAVANGTLRKTDYDFDAHEFDTPSARARTDVVADMFAARRANTLIGPMRNRTYNQYGAELLRPATMTRAEVKSSVVEAMQDGTLRRSDYEDVPVTVARRASRNRPAARVLATATLRSPG